MMRLLGLLLTACVVVAALQAAAAVLVLMVLVGIVFGLVTKPKETLAFAAILAFASIVEKHPATLLAIVGITLTACLIGKAIERIGGQ